MSGLAFDMLLFKEPYIYHFRQQKLGESEDFQIFVGKVEEEEAWMNEKQQILSSDNFGENMAGVQGLLKKHDAFEADLALHTQRIDHLIAEGQKVSFIFSTES